MLICYVMVKLSELRKTNIPYKEWRRGCLNQDKAIYFLSYIASGQLPASVYLKLMHSSTEECMSLMEVRESLETLSDFPDIEV